MSEIRCPMCGKENPAELEVCQFCEARLKPLVLPSESETEGETTSGSVGSVTDWLSSLSDEDEGENRSVSGEQQDDAGEQQPGSQAEDSDWLSSLRTEGAVDQIETDDTDDAADWSQSEEEQGEGIPEWLTNLGREDETSGDTDATVEEEPSARIEPEAADQPLFEGEDNDALSVEEQEQPSVLEEAEQEFNIEEYEFEESPEVDSDAGIEESTPQELANEPVIDISAGEGEEVLEGESFSSEAEPFPETEPEGDSSVLEADQEGTPEWLAEIIEEEAVTSAEQEDGTAQVPDWLTEIEEATDLGEIELPTVEETDFDWLEGEEEQIEPAITAPEADLDAGVVPPFTLDEEESEVVSSEDVPEWLADIPQIETGPEPEVIKEEPEGLEQAELPSWLESMRPVEAAAPALQFTDESELETESSGPLAGLRGVLPVEPEIVQIKKPSVYALKLQVSDQQRVHANLFDELIKKEGESPPIEKGAVVSPQIILRVAIFVLLLVAVMFPIYTGSQDVPITEIPVESFEVSRMINNLNVGEPVLLAVDYEPGYSGELEAASATVLDNLMIRGAYLTIVSTSPTGPALAERLIKTVNINGGHDYQPGNQYRNLGFIPGGASGLRAFAQTPQQVLPTGIDGQPVWDVSPLDSIHKLSDFAYLIVLTESPETGRFWIEQVQPSLGNAGLMMVISAQAEPLMRPYFDEPAKQVQGLVTGLAGGAAYESGMPRPMFARKYWDAFSYSLIVAVLIIVFGSTINAISAYVVSQKREGRGSTK